MHQLPGVWGGDPRERLRVPSHLGERCAPYVGAELLVEELFELERSLPLRRIRRIERWVRPALLDRGDDARRIADRAPVEGEDGRRRRIAGQALGL
jgi:hypothetical protein